LLGTALGHGKMTMPNETIGAGLNNNAGEFVEPVERSVVRTRDAVSETMPTPARTMDEDRSTVADHVENAASKRARMRPVLAIFQVLKE
jgi:hypothetical protein